MVGDQDGAGLNVFSHGQSFGCLYHTVFEQQRRLAQFPTLILPEAKRDKRVNNNTAALTPMLFSSFENFDLLK